MPRLREPQPVTEHRRAWWCARHGWWFDTDENATAAPECGVDPCGGREMQGPFSATVLFTPAARDSQETTP